MQPVKAFLDKLLVDDWPRALKWLSVQFSLLLVAFPTLPQEWQAAIILAVVTPLGLSAAQLPMLLGAVYLVIRLVRQSRPATDNEP